MAGGDAGEITKPRGGKSEEQVGIITDSEIMDQSKRQQMGQMTDRSENAVMHFRRQFIDIGTTQRPGALDAVETFVFVFRQWCNDDLLALIQIPACRCRTTILGAGYRVCRNEFADMPLEGCPRGGNDIALG